MNARQLKSRRHVRKNVGGKETGERKRGEKEARRETEMLWNTLYTPEKDESFR